MKAEIQGPPPVIVRATKEFRFEAAHRLMLHEGACRNLHGHSYRLVVTIAGERKKAGPATDMVLDFSVLSTIVKGFLEDGFIGAKPTIPFDHSVILHQDDPLVTVLEVNADAKVIGDLRIVKMVTHPTAEAMAVMFASIINTDLAERPGDLWVQRVELWETAKAFAAWDADDQPRDMG